jgi:cell division protein FtsL
MDIVPEVAIVAAAPYETGITAIQHATTNLAHIESVLFTSLIFVSIYLNCFITGNQTTAYDP